jgi:hypothetical protein
VQSPIATSVTVLPLTVHTGCVSEVNVTGKLLDAVALTVKGGLPTVFGPNGPKVIVCAVCGAVGVTLFDGADGGPVPTLLVAVTVNAYGVPLVSPCTLIDVHGAVQLPVMDPGDDVAV